MCSKLNKCCKLCIICITLTCLPTVHTNDKSNQQSAKYTETPHNLIPNNSVQLTPDGHTRMSKEEMIRARDFYLQDLVERFGSNGLINFDGIINLLESLGISRQSRLLENQPVKHQHYVTGSHAVHSQDAVYGKHLLNSDNDTNHLDSNHDNHPHPDTNHEDNENHHNHTDSHDHTSDLGDDTRKRRSSETTSLTSSADKSTNDKEKCEDLFSDFHIHEGETIDTEDLLQVCPGILSTLSRAKCREGNSEESPVQQRFSVTFSEIPPAVWGYSTIATIVISLVGLLGVAVVPIMKKSFYNHLFSFLVALAVGALSGDAMLHLLPHALLGGHHSDEANNNNEKGDKHHTAVLKGLCGMGAICLFFTMERLLSIITNIKYKQKKKAKRPLFVKDSKQLDDKLTIIPLTTGQCGAMPVTDLDCKGQVLGIHPGQKAINNFLESSLEKCSVEHVADNNNDRQVDIVDEENASDILCRSQHGHSHVLPTTVASLAWMVLLGDGIHNLCDGLAIGAAFSSSITEGFSTSVAIFCHELPHEVGDFAVLLKAGMTVKQAILYSSVSAFLAFIGMVVGVAIGHIGDSLTWVYVSVAGMFLYIALVDMLPELTTVYSKQGEQPLFHLFIQLLGMVVGASILFLIALYEQNLMNILEPV
ncbi:zinc transporter ZIP6-like [Argopecten irradians]|uniref:zinc transporter ZIP6-like n=1 Tax=Argopecten irradians TaxID=31199 RepID=UPI00371B177D